MQKERYEFLDWLRVIAIFVLLFFHTGMLFVGWGWHITNAETIPALEWPMDLAHRLRMPLLFVIAGAGMWFALRSRGAGAFLGERTMRLLVPVVIGMLLIVPPQIYVERLAQGQFAGSYLEFMTQRVFQFRPYPQGDFSWHHLWFIVYLYAYVLLLAPLLLWWRRRTEAGRPAPRAGAWLYVLALPLGINEALLKPLYPETHNLTHDWYVFIHYLLLTVYGYLLASIPGAWDWMAARRRLSLAGAIVVTAGLVWLLVSGTVPHDTPFDHVFANVLTWFWLLAFMGYGRAYLSFGNRLLAWARDASYPVYILHQTAIIIIAYFVVGQPWTPWTKYWVVLAGTLVGSVLTYQLLFRRVAILRLAFGIKGHAAPTRMPAAAQLRRRDPAAEPRLR